MDCIHTEHYVEDRYPYWWMALSFSGWSGRAAYPTWILVHAAAHLTLLGFLYVRTHLGRTTASIVCPLLVSVHIFILFIYGRRNEYLHAEQRSKREVIPLRLANQEAQGSHRLAATLWTSAGVHSHYLPLLFPHRCCFRWVRFLRWLKSIHVKFCIPLVFID